MLQKTNKSKEKPITAAQVRRIHTILHTLGIEDSNYREALQNRFDVGSCKELTIREAQSFIAELEQLLRETNEADEEARFKAALHKRMEEIRQSWDLPYSNLDNRPGMATGAQLRKIEVMWTEISIIPDPDARGRALRRFVQRIAGVASLRFLDLEGASKVINALDAMQKQAANGKTPSRQGAGQ